MGNSILYEAMIKSTLGKKELHGLLILLDYFISIFPYISSSITKIKYWNSTFHYSELENIFIFFSKSKEQMINLQSETSVLFLIYMMSIIVLTIILTVLFIVIQKFYKKKKYSSFIKLLLNIYNLFFFRYLSYYFIDSFCFSFFYLINEDKVYIKDMISYGNIIIAVVYFFCAFFFISEYSFYCSINNKMLCNYSIKYPFDGFSEKFDQGLLVMKIIVSFDSNYLLYKNNKPDNITLFLQILLIFYSIFIFYRCFIENKNNYNILIKQLLGNIELNFIRKFIVAFNCLLIFNHVIVEEKDVFVELSNLLINIFLSIIIIVINWIYLEQKIIGNLIKDNRPEIFLLLILHDLSPNASTYTKTDFDNNLKSFSLIKRMDVITNKFLERIQYELRINQINGIKSNKSLNTSQYDKNDSSDNQLYSRLIDFFEERIRASQKHLKKNYMFWFLVFIYSLIKHDIYKINQAYQKLIFSNKIKVPKIFKNTIIFLFQQNISHDTKISSFYIYNSIHFSKFDEEVKKTLNRCFKYINENINYKKCSELLDISKEIEDHQKIFIEILKQIEEKIQISSTMKLNPKSPLFKKNQIGRTIQSIYRYSSLIFRYIFENFTNMSFPGLPSLSIDGFEDLLNFHYSNDNIMILSKASDEENNYFEILKATGISQKGEKFLSDFFPKNFRYEGNRKLAKCLFETKYPLNYDFDYFIERNNFYEHIHLDFDLGHSMDSKKIILYGFYSFPQKNTILFKVEKNNLIIRGFSKMMSNLLGITIETFELLKAHFNNKVFLSYLFQGIVIINNDTALFSKNILEKIKLIKCKIDYSKLYDFLLNVLKKEAKDKVKRPEKNKIKKIIAQVESELEKMEGKKAELSFEKLFTINEYYGFFMCIMDKKKLKLLINHSNIGKASLNKSSIDEEQIEEDFLKNNLNVMLSQTSMTDGSVSTKSGYSTVIAKAKKQNTYSIPIIKKEVHKLSLVSKLIILFNSFSLILCIAFLFLQTSQTKLLTNAIKLSYSFLGLRHSFSTVFYSTISFTCIEEEENCEPNYCVNRYVLNGMEYQKLLGFTEFSLVGFFWFDLSQKVSSLKNYYTEFKQNLLSKQFSQFSFLLDFNITYNFIEQRPDELIQVIDTITFDSGIEKTINSEMELINGEDETKYIYVPYYIITADDGLYDLKKLKNQNFNHYQASLFRVISNFVNFLNSFKNGASVIENYFTKSKEQNLILCSSFMAAFLFINGIIFFFNINHVKSSQLLFQKLMGYSCFRMNVPEIRENINQKIKYLLELAELYSRNPNSIIQEISKSQSQWMKKSVNIFNDISNSALVISTDLENPNAPKIGLDSLINELKPNSFQMKDFTESYMIPLFIKSILLFLFYFIVIGICDILLLVLLFEVYSFKNYVDLNYDIQSLLYTDISLFHFYHLVNTTKQNLIDVLEAQSKDGDIVNYYIRTSFENYDQLINEVKNPKFPSIEEYVPFECEEMFNKMRNEALDTYVDLTGLDNSMKNSIPIQICKNLRFDQLKYAIYEDYFDLILKLNNRYQDRDFNGICAPLKDTFLFKAYMYLHFYFVPIKSSFDTNILIPLITSKIDGYTVFLWIYLIMNIVIESIIFFLHKILIIKNLDHIQKYLYMSVQAMS